MVYQVWSKSDKKCRSYKFTDGRTAPYHNTSRFFQTGVWKDNPWSNTLKNFCNLPLTSKVLERKSCLQTCKAASREHQSAYRKFHSTETALLNVHSDILPSLDHNKIAVLWYFWIFLLHLHLWSLHTYKSIALSMTGISGKSLAWMTSYSARYQTVCIDGELSEPVLMQCSELQGSVFGSKNYTMYTKHVRDLKKSWT